MEEYPPGEEPRDCRHDELRGGTIGGGGIEHLAKFGGEGALYFVDLVRLTFDSGGRE